MPERRGGAIEIREPRTDAEWAACFDLRWRVLRAPWGQPHASERDDLENDSRHRLAIDADGRVIGVGRLHRLDDRTGQIRYMAVEPDCERQGVGTRILLALEDAARDAGLRSIRLHAREGAAPFYARRGYRTLGPSHVLFGEVRHLLMEKRL